MSKTVLISGASSGFGALTARALADAGHIVYAGMRDVAGRNACRLFAEVLPGGSPTRAAEICDRAASATIFIRPPEAEEEQPLPLLPGGAEGVEIPAPLAPEAAQ